MEKIKPLKILEQIRNYKPIEVNYAFYKTISFSQMSMYFSCPKKWALQYQEGHRFFTSTINTVFGTAIHETIQHYLTVLYEQSGVKADDINLEEYFEERFREVYIKEYQSNNKIHFSNPEEMREFFDDGVAILDFVKKKRNEYFSKRNWHLVGVEIPIVLSPNQTHNNILFNGFIDLVLYNESTQEFVIYDIKTSSRGWSDKEKKDEIKQLQILLYKQFFSEQFGVPLENIDVKFFILKRKIWENSEFPQKRVQEFTPANGKTKLKYAKTSLETFINSTFNLDGSYKYTDHQANPSKSNCRYCPFLNNQTLCSESVK